MFSESDSRNLALLVQRVDQILESQKRIERDQKIVNDDHENRIRAIESKMTGWQVAQGVYTTVVGIVAGMIGRSR